MAREVIRIRNEFYVRSSSARVDVRMRVLKQGDTFAVFDRFGDIETFGTGELGLYYQDTRFLSRLTLETWKGSPATSQFHCQRRQRGHGGGCDESRCLARWRDSNPARNAARVPVEDSVGENVSRAASNP